MIRRRDLCRSSVRCLTAFALIFALGTSVNGADLDQRLAANPALGRIAAVDPAAAQRLLDAIDQVLRRPAPPPMRGGPDLNAEDESLLAENPLLGEVYAHDPMAALELLIRVKGAARPPSRR